MTNENKEDKSYQWTVKIILVTLLLVLTIVMVGELYKWTINRLNPGITQQPSFTYVYNKVSGTWNPLVVDSGEIKEDNLVDLKQEPHPKSHRHQKFLFMPHDHIGAAGQEKVKNER